MSQLTISIAIMISVVLAFWYFLMYVLPINSELNRKNEHYNEKALSDLFGFWLPEIRPNIAHRYHVYQALAVNILINETIRINTYHQFFDGDTVYLSTGDNVFRLICIQDSAPTTDEDTGRTYYRVAFSVDGQSS